MSRRSRPSPEPTSRCVAGCITRVVRVVRVLTVVGALGDELAGQVLDDFELNLGTRGVRSPGQYGRALRSQAWSLPPGQTAARARPQPSLSGR